MWVKALVRRCASSGVTATVARHGDDGAGAIFVKLRLLDGTARLHGPAPAGLTPREGERRFSAHLNPAGAPEPEVDAYMTRQISFDPDLWLVEIDDRQGRDFLEL